MSAIMAKMSRTTIMADDALLEQLRSIAKEEGISLGEVMRQGLEWRARGRHRPPSCIEAIGCDGPTTDDASRVDELVAEYLLEEHSRY